MVFFIFCFWGPLGKDQICLSRGIGLGNMVDLLLGTYLSYVHCGSFGGRGIIAPSVDCVEPKSMSLRLLFEWSCFHISDMHYVVDSFLIEYSFLYKFLRGTFIHILCT